MDIYLPLRAQRERGFQHTNDESASISCGPQFCNSPGELDALVLAFECDSTPVHRLGVETLAVTPKWPSDRHFPLSAMLPITLRDSAARSWLNAM